MELSTSDWKYVDERAGSFVGREWVFEKVRGFLSGPPGTFLLHGDPGTGKTAIAGRIAQASSGHGATDNLPAQPAVARETISAAVFCRAEEAFVPDLIKDLCRQLARSVEGFAAAFLAALPEASGKPVLPPIDVRDVRVEAGEVHAGAKLTGVEINLDVVINALSDNDDVFMQAVVVPLRHLREIGAAQRIVVLVDAVDEATAVGKANTFSAGLGKLSGIHLIVTCRSDARVLVDFRKAGHQVDLIADAPPGDADVNEYARNRLRRYGSEDVIAAMADRIASESAGNFLYAFFVTGALAQSKSLDGIDKEAARGLPLPTGGLSGVYEDFLYRQIGSDTAKWAEELRPVLASLCVALGDGFTTAQLGAIASRLTGKDFSITKAGDVTQAAGQFLDGPRPNGPFRVYHQSFARFLGDPGQNPYWSINLTDTNNAIVQALSESVPEGQPGVKDWAAADGYVRRHLAAHAAAVGRLDAFIGDPEFVLACDLDRLLTVLDQARTEEGRTTADVIVRAAAYLEPRTPDSASYLQMFARQYGAAAFADRVGHLPGHPLPWSTRWAHVIPRTPHRVLGHHQGPATTVTSLLLPGAGQVAVSGGADGVVRVWNLDPGGPVRESLTIGAPVRSVTPLPRSDGQLGVLVLDQAGTCVWWDLTDSPALPLNLKGRQRCDCVTALERDGTSTALLGRGRTIVEYDINRDREVRTIRLASSGKGHQVQVSSIAVLPLLKGDGMLVADLSGGVIAVVDLASGSTVRTFSASGLRLLAAARVGGRNVALLQGRRDIQFWDLDGRTRVGCVIMQGPCGYGTMTDGRPVLLATDMDGMFGAWDLSGLVASCSPQAADEMTDLLFKELPALPTSAAEGSESLSPEQLAQVISDAPASLGLGGPVRVIAAIAHADGRGATVAYAGPGHQRLWPTKPSSPDAGPGVFATNRGPLPGLPAAVPSAINVNNNRIDAWILPPPPGRGQRLLGHVGDVTAATLTAPVAGGDYALSVGDDGTIRSWHLQLGPDVPHGLAERNERPSSLTTAYAGDLGQVIIAGCVDGQLRTWSLPDGQMLGKPLTGNGYAVRSLATTETSTGTVVGALHQNRELRIWRLTTSEMFVMVNATLGFAFTVVDDRAVAVAIVSAYDKLQVFDLSTIQQRGQSTPLAHQATGFRPTPIASVGSPDGYKLLLTENGQLKAVDVISGESGDRSSIVLGPSDDAIDLALLTSTSGSTRLVAITSSGPSVWELRGGLPLTPRALPDDVTLRPGLSGLLATGRLPDGAAVAVLGQPQAREFCFLDPDDMTPFGVITMDTDIDALAVGDDGTVIVATESGLLALTPSTARVPLPPAEQTPLWHGQRPQQ